MKKEIIGSLFAMIAIGVMAQDAASARAAYQERQALAEVPRLVQQFDQLAANQDEIVQRLLKVESGSGTEAALRAEIEALRAEVAELKASIRREQDAMRREIVADLAKRISTLTPPPPPPAPVQPRPVATARPAPATPPPPAEIGPHYEYVVEKGQTLSLIADPRRQPRPEAESPARGAEAHHPGRGRAAAAEEGRARQAVAFDMFAGNMV